MSEPVIEKVILGSLIHNPYYNAVVLPHTRREFFESDANAIVFEIISKYHDKYGEMPSLDAAEVELASYKGLTEEGFREAELVISKTYREEVKHGLMAQKLDWLLDKTEERFIDRSCFLAIMESLEILEGTGKASRDAIPDLLAKAVSISFTSELGHDYLDEWEKRYREYHKQVEKIPFSLHMLNRVTDGGYERKTLSLFISGCVHPDTKVRIRLRKFEQELTVPISAIKDLLNDYEVEIDTPDGWQPVLEFVEKDMYTAYRAVCTDGRECLVNEAHLFETPAGWMPAMDMVQFEDVPILMDDGQFHLCYVEELKERIPIVDIVVGHPNHRYYANGFSSHNTNVGKTMTLTNESAHLLMQGKNVLYITLEMSEEKIAERIDAKLLQTPMSNIRKISFDTYRNNMMSLKSRTSGKLVIQQYPPRTVTVKHIESLMNDLKAKRGFVPDVICVDYMTLLNSYSMKSGGYENLYVLGKLVAEELRALAIRRDVAILSASQTNRSGQANTDFDITDLGESHAISQTADFMVGLISTPELELLGQLRMKLLKSRFGPLNDPNSFIVGIERAKMTLFDIDYKAPVDNTNSTSIPNTDNVGNTQRPKFKGITGLNFDGDIDDDAPF